MMQIRLADDRELSCLHSGYYKSAEPTAGATVHPLCVVLSGFHCHQSDTSSYPHHCQTRVTFSKSHQDSSLSAACPSVH